MKSSNECSRQKIGLNNLDFLTNMQASVFFANLKLRVQMLENGKKC